MPVTRWIEGDRYTSRSTTEPVSLSSFTTDDLTVGTTNKYQNIAQIQASFTASSPLSYNGAGNYSTEDPFVLNDLEVQGELGHSGAAAGFFGSSPAPQPTDIGLEVVITDGTSGTVDGSLVAISGTGDDTNVNNNFADLASKVNDLVGKVNALRAQQQTLGLMA